MPAKSKKKEKGTNLDKFFREQFRLSQMAVIGIVALSIISFISTATFFWLMSLY